MHIFALIAGVFCCLGVALDAFQTIVLPRRPTGRARITGLFFSLTWDPWTRFAARSGNKKIREQAYSIYGPLSLLLLLLIWALLLITGFGLIYFSSRAPFGDAIMQTPTTALWKQLATDLYVSGTTLFTLGLGDVVPHSPFARALIIIESGTGLGFVALVIGYLPVLYQAFSRREVNVALLDSRAGSPPNAAELMRRHAFEGGEEVISHLLEEWERWSAEILESHISYPILCYYRSQHDSQSWLSALVSILDVCALHISVIEGAASRQAQLTFVMARHALIDIGEVFHVQDRPAWQEAQLHDRLPRQGFYMLCDALHKDHMQICGDPAAARRLDTIRALYEQQAYALSDYLRMPLPVWVAPPKDNDQWSLLTRMRNDAHAAVEAVPHHNDYFDDEEG